MGGYDKQSDIPAFQRIKDYLLSEIHVGNWKEGDAIPSEQVLARQFGVSRMTVNRAVRELTAEQILTRIQGSGTYVAPHKYQSTLVEIKNIADEVRARGHAHHSVLHELKSVKPLLHLATQFGISTSDRLFHSVIVHFENDIPIQVEQRWVNPAVAPHYMHQDFMKMTPNEYLMTVAPLQGVQYSIEAVIPPGDIATMLQISSREPCLILKRKTFSGDLVATLATMWHPGSRYQFAGSF